jgi:hypothetical protein
MIRAVAIGILFSTLSFEQLTPKTGVELTQYDQQGSSFVQTTREAYAFDSSGKKTLSVTNVPYNREATGDFGIQPTCSQYIVLASDPKLNGVGSFDLLDKESGTKIQGFTSSPIRELSSLEYVKFHKSCAQIFSLAFGPTVADGEWVFQLRVFDVATGIILYSKDTSDYISSVFIAPDFQYFAITYYSRFAILNFRNLEYRFFDEDHSKFKLFFENDRRFVNEVTYDKVIRHDVVDKRVVSTSVAPESVNVDQAELLPNSDHEVLMSGYRTSNLISYSLNTQAFMVFETKLKGQIDTFCVSPNGAYVAAISEHSLVLIKLKDGSIQKTFEFEPDIYPNHCAINNDAHQIIIGTDKLGARRYRF